MTALDTALALAFDGAKGRVVWRARRGQGSMLTLELGDALPPRPRTGAVHGEWHLWLYSCAWRLDGPDAMLVGSEDDDVDRLATLDSLNGATLVDVTVDAPGMDTAFVFSGGLTLRTFALLTADEDHWLWYFPPGQVLTVGPGSAWSVEASG